MPLLRTLAIACSATAVLVSADARCDDAPLVLGREQALALGAERGPGVREARAPLRAASELGDSTRAALAYAPRITAFAGPRTGNFGTGLDIGAGVTQELSLRGLGSRRADLAAAVAHAARSEVERARLEGAALAALAWVDLLEAQQLVLVRAAARVDAEEIARVARARTDRGVAPPAEAALATAEVGTAEVSERDAEGRLFEARAALQFAAGFPPSTVLAAAGDLTSGHEPPPLRHAGGEHPAETAARSRTDLARADQKLARAQATPTLGIGANYTREGTGEQVVTGTISVPLPFLDPSRFDGARHETSVAAAGGQAERIHAELVRDAAITEHERAHTREVRETLATRVVIPLRESERLARAAYQGGTQDVTAFLLVRQRRISAEEQLGRAAADVQRADLRYELAHGTLLAQVKR
ncbi:MAG: Heavy metal efflux outer membrane protein CzcC family [Myxococcaceae bacterium]|nr:Heavy metal efflux outer membrane protein CzcC family [Myxococcaceae bacterium]